VRRCNTAISDS